MASAATRSYRFGKLTLRRKSPAIVGRGSIGLQLSVQQSLRKRSAVQSALNLEIFN
jgi:hypothetical protein